MSVGITQNIKPFVTIDYSEPRVDSMFYVRNQEYKISSYISTNYSNPIAIDLNASFKTVKRRLTKPWQYSFSYAPRIRFSNKFLFTLSNSYTKVFQDAGYVSKSNDSIFFGVRNISNQILTMEFDYNIRRNVSFNLRLRHNWTLVNYLDYYLLSPKGFLYPLSLPYHYFSNRDVNSNFFNIDFIFKWIIVPGSEITVSYKLNVSSSSDILIYNYYGNFENMYLENPNIQSLSVKLILYLNTQTVRKIKRSR